MRQLLTKWAAVIGLTLCGTACNISNNDVTSNPLVAQFGTAELRQDEFRYWLKTMRLFYLQTQRLPAITDWTTTVSGTPLRAWLVDGALHYACLDRALRVMAQREAVSITAAQQGELQVERARDLRAFGGVSEYQRMLNSQYESESVYLQLRQAGYLRDNLFRQQYGGDAMNCSAACVAAAIAARQLVAAHYFHWPRDGKGWAQRAGAQQQLLRRLRAAQAPAVRFMQLLGNTDVALQSRDYPDGRLIADGALGPEVAAALAQLPIGGISDIVSAADGDYLLLRMPVLPDMRVDADGQGLRHWIALEQHFKPAIAATCQALPRTLRLTRAQLEALT